MATNKEKKEIDNLSHVLEERKVKHRLLKPKKQILLIQNKYRQESYRRAKEYKENLRIDI